jgi:hypothetical protein
VDGASNLALSFTRKRLRSHRCGAENVLIVFLTSHRLAPRAGALLGVALLASFGCVDLSRPGVLSNQDSGAHDGGVDKPVDRPDLGAEAGGEVAADSDVPVEDAGSDGGDTAGDGSLDVRLDNGQGCASNGECASGACVDHVCCSTACDGACHACNVPGAEGTCTPIAAGEDPADECAMEAASTCGRDGTCDGAGACRRYGVGTECQPGSCTGSTETPASTCDVMGVCRSATARACAGGAVCQGASCATSCTADANCQTGFFCDGGVCRAKRSAGATCTGKSECASGYCVDRVCCGTPCTELCSVCNLAGALGRCKPVPAGQDPRNVCALDAVNPCGNDGACDGSGLCRRPSGNACGSSSCNGGVETPPGKCNGAGTCAPQPAKDCGTYQCAGYICATSCASDAGCAPGSTCTANACVPLPGPVLRWKLDEPGGATAFDASGNGFNGTYVGNGAAAPTASPLLPPLLFPNAASRAFDRNQHEAIQLSSAPAALRPTADVTLSAWYRSTSGTTSSNSEDVISGGDAYGMRVWSAIPKIAGSPPGVEVSKHTSTGHFQCFLVNNNVLDGNWHHLAGVITSASMQVYVDGVPSASCALAMPIAYIAGNNDLWVGRHGGGVTATYDFDGNIDEVRVYSRALSAGEIARLAAGQP